MWWRKNPLYLFRKISLLGWYELFRSVMLGLIDDMCREKKSNVFKVDDYDNNY